MKRISTHRITISFDRHNINIMMFHFYSILPYFAFFVNEIHSLNNNHNIIPGMGFYVNTHILNGINAPSEEIDSDTF